MIDTHPRLFRALCVLIVLLGLLCAWLFPLPTGAQAPPQLTIFTVNNLGRADLLPNDTVQIVIELRSDTPYQDVTAQHLAPEGVTLIGATVSRGALATLPFVSWKGPIAPDQPVNIVLSYRVNQDAVPGDRRVAAQAQIAGVLLRATTVLRVCCRLAPDATGHGIRVWLPVIRAEQSPRIAARAGRRG